MEEYNKFFKVSSEDKKLELRLGPPGEFLGFKNMKKTTTINGGKDQEIRRLFEANEKQPLISKSSSSSMNVEGPRSVVDLQCSLDKKKACSGSVNTAIAGTSGTHKRGAAAPVVGWPPIRSFRKNLGSSSNSKPEPENGPNNNTPREECSGKKPNCFIRNDGLFVKINMEGVPIGRKINLNAYDSYEKLSVAIDGLFRGLLASSGAGPGEYTLVYEDTEGDRILVGDVPWHMFVSAVKRLRVLKSCKLSSP